MQERVKIGEIKRAIKTNRILAKGDENIHPSIRYTKKEREWEVYDSSIEDFGQVFDEVLPNKNYEPDLYTSSAPTEHFQIFRRKKGENFKNYIEETLLTTKKREHDLTAVEFGGPGSKLFKGFTKDLFRKTVGVCLKDIRSDDQKKEDAKINHSLIVGDITEVIDDEMFRKLHQTLGVNKIDLIISKMEGPLKKIDRYPAILDRIIRNWYNMLNENGIIFVEFAFGQPNDPNRVFIRKWVKVIEEKFPQIEIQLGIEVLRLHKKIGAPEKLPPTTQLFNK